ncbi:MAG: hypothetical protein HXY34_01435 [Candidatus Thorarchaeota archaeon]|nr:hypothetical protein [Candidatus Thorarchaeota archaeon]
MSNGYTQNRSMVICIIAMIGIGSLLAGFAVLLGSSGWNWSSDNTPRHFDFDELRGPINETVVLNVTMDVGAVTVSFVDNSTLLYRIGLTTTNSTVIKDGAPTVTLQAGVINLDYTVGTVVVYLGSGIAYDLRIKTTTGDVVVTALGVASVSDISLTSSVGAVRLTMTESASLVGNVTCDLETDVGDISVNIDLAAAIGGSFGCTTGIGSVSISAPGWTQIDSRHYQTANYATASQRLTITAKTGTGSVSAVLM